MRTLQTSSLPQEDAPPPTTEANNKNQGIVLHKYSADRLGEDRLRKKKPRAGEETTRGRPRYSWWRRRARCQAPKCHRVSATASDKYGEVAVLTTFNRLSVPQVLVGA
jgi:hypothetical protein